MRRVRKVIAAAVLIGFVTVVGACADRRTTYVNETTQERLDLYGKRTLKNVAIGTVHGVNMGRYHLGKPGGEILTGEYIWKSDTIDLRESAICLSPRSVRVESSNTGPGGEAIVLDQAGPCAEKRSAVELKIDHDGSLRDAAGNIWKPAIVRTLVEETYQLGSR